MPQFSGFSRARRRAAHSTPPSPRAGTRAPRSVVATTCSASAKRAAFAQPRALMGAMVVLVGAGVWWAAAQNTTSGTRGVSGGDLTPPRRVTLQDLPSMVMEYGARRARVLREKASQNVTGIGKRDGFALTETDLTPNTPSDEREPIYSPSGAQIAFASNGVLTNGRLAALNTDGPSGTSRYHIFIIDRGGGGLRQLTGLGADRSRDQRHPSWAPDGQQLVYTDTPIVIPASTSSTQLFVVRPFDDANTAQAGIQVGTPEQRTFSPGRKLSPTWSATGQSIAFSADYDLTKVTPDALNQLDIFTIAPTGEQNSVQRLTGGTNDPLGNATDDINPCYATTQVNLIYFSSNRAADAAGNIIKLNNVGRRIWFVNDTTFTLQQVTNSRIRSGGRDSDRDDYPSVSNGLDVGGGAAATGDRIAFQTDTYIDRADITSGSKSKDFNIWTLTVNSAQFQPTPTATPVPAPVLVVSGSTSNTVGEYSAQTGKFNRVLITAAGTGNANGVTNPAGIAYYDINNDGAEDLLVANRNGGTNGAGSVDAYDARTGAFLRRVVTGSSLTGNLLTNPSFIKVVGNNLFVGSGPNDPGFNAATPQATVQGSGNGVFRFTLPAGTANPGAGSAAPSARFTNGENSAGQITNGVEGFDFDEQGNLYVAAVNDNIVNQYSPTGVFSRTFIAAGSGGLTKPTGVRFTIDGDFLLVASNATDAIKRYDATSGAYVDDLVSDTNGTTSTRQLNSPYGIEFNDSNQDGTRELFTTSARVNGDANLQDPVNTPDGIGINVLRFDSSTPNTPVGVNPFASDAQVRGVTYFAFNAQARALTIPTTPTPTPLPQTVEGDISGVAQLETSLTSAPDRVPGFDGAIEDRLEDIEPAVSRATTNNQVVSQITFVSLRRAAAVPGAPLANGGNAAPTVQNQYGGEGGTHDLWTTTTRDTTPPILIPQAAGNQTQFPVLAPGLQAAQIGLNAPRTPEDRQTFGGQGLQTNSQFVTAFVLAEPESGISSVTVSFRNAAAPSFTPFVDTPNENITTTLNFEGKPPVVTGFGQMPVDFYDDGPPTRKSRKTGQNGHERQPNAVEGDGIYYCESRNSLNTAAPQILTPPTAGDYYMDIAVNDVAGNAFTYDNIWGFSTQTFPASASNTTDLFVSDYTAGQDFVYLLNNTSSADVGDATGRFFPLFPNESYYLNNPAGVAYTDATRATVAAVQNPVTYSNVDVYRVLCRGPITENQLAAYAPSAVFQLNPNETTNGNPGPFLDRTRRLADAKRVVLWASPYAGTSFVGPGTIADSNVQRILTNFLESGGRLFLDGEDVLYALTNGGLVNNDFVANELQTSFGGEAGFLNGAVDKLTAGAGKFTFFSESGFPADWDNPQIFPRNEKATFFGSPPPYTTEQVQNSYSDAAIGGIRVDLMGASTGGAGTTVTPAYTIATGNSVGALVGQRIQRTRTNGVNSRAVFFSFDLAAVNRRYGVFNNQTFAIGVRRGIANSIRSYLKTGGLSGTIINSGTNQALPNFLVVANGEGGPYLARTDASGFYEFQGLPSGFFTVQPAPAGLQNLANQNLGFFNTNTPVGVNVDGAQTATGVNFRVQPISPGTLSAVVADQSGAPIPNLPVLVKTVDENSVFPGGGPFVQLSRTNAAGRFTFANVPASVNGQPIDLRVVLNPDVTDIPELQTDLRNTYQAAGGPRPEYARRQLPDTDRPTAIRAVPSNTYYLNETDPDTQADDGNPLILAARLRRLTGVVAAQTVPGVTTGANRATVTLVSQTDGQVKQTTTTDSGGRYNFTEVAFDNYRVQASLDLGGPRNPSTPGLPVVGLSPAFRVAAGPTAQITITGILLQARDLRGQVTYNNAAPNGATVQLLSGTTVVDTVRSATVNGRTGTYTFSNIPAGTYTVRATFTVGSSTSTAQASTTVTINSNSPEVLSGPNLSIFQRTIFGTVSRRATNSGGTATTTLAPGATVTLQRQGSTAILQSKVTDSNGAYSFDNLENGTYIVTATLPSGASQSATVTVTNADTSKPQNFTITEGAISGIVYRNLTTRSGPSRTGASGARVTATGTAGTFATTTNANGRYDFSGLVPGTYNLVATLSSGATSETKTVTVSVDRSANQDFDIFEGSLFGVVVYNVGGSLSNAAGAVVTVTQNGTQVYGPLTIGTNGLYDINNVRPGTYTVTATFQGEALSATVTIPATGASASTNLTFTRQGVYGKVTFNGAAQSGATVRLLNAAGATQATQTSNAQGNFLFSPVVNGTYTVQATLGIRRGTKTAVVPANGQILNIGNVELSDSSSDTAGPYTEGNTYLITVPYTDSDAALSTTQVFKAFTALPTGSDGVKNYQLLRYDPLATATNGGYIELNANSTIQRGQGLLLRVLRNSVGILTPTVDNSRKAINGGVTSFALTLRRASSNSTDQGQNLIGSPFAGRTINYLNSQVVYNGRTLTLQQAVSEQLISPSLTTYVNGTTTTTQSTTLAPNVGYFVNAYQDNIQLILNIS